MDSNVAIGIVTVVIVLGVFALYYRKNKDSFKGK